MAIVSPFCVMSWRTPRDQSSNRERLADMRCVQVEDLRVNACAQSRSHLGIRERTG